MQGNHLQEALEGLEWLESSFFEKFLKNLVSYSTPFSSFSCDLAVISWMGHVGMLMWEGYNLQQICGPLGPKHAGAAVGLGSCASTDLLLAEKLPSWIKDQVCPQGTGGVIRSVVGFA